MRGIGAGQVFMFICSWTLRNHYHSIYHLFIFIFVLYSFKFNVVLFFVFGLSLHKWDFCTQMFTFHGKTSLPNNELKILKKWKTRNNTIIKESTRLHLCLEFDWLDNVCLTEQYHFLNQWPQFTIYSFIYHSARIGYTAYSPAQMLLCCICCY